MKRLKPITKKEVLRIRNLNLIWSVLSDDEKEKWFSNNISLDMIEEFRKMWDGMVNE